MYIVFLGNFEVSYTSENHYMKTLRKMGHIVMPLQEGKTNSSQILQRAVKADMFLWVHTHGWKTEGIAEVIEILKEKEIPTVGYHLDLWVGLERFRDLQTDPYWSIEHFFTVDKLFADYLNGNDKLPKAYFLPAGVFEEETYKGEVKEEYMHDIAFVGSGIYHPEWQYRGQLIQWLHDNFGDRFAHYGRGGLPNVREKNLNDVYASTKVIVGDTLCKGFAYPYYLSDRVFETTGRNGFIIHPYIQGIEDLFKLPVDKGNGDLDTSEAELITYPFGDFEYLRYLIEYFIKNEDEREGIRARGRARTLKDHTYTNRMQFILDNIFVHI